ncbi:MAG: YjjG family noncanonical pyrimidine nucleotidase [Anaerolineales bacterium]|nr:YjjG family noncanonical pyrimidine nucleotidase [Anaerolineales bacterium]
MKKYRWLLFDADGTLFDFARAEESALAQTCQTLGIDFQPAHAEAYRRINVAAWHAFEQGELSLTDLRSIRFARFFAEFGLEGDPLATSDQYIAFLGQGHYLLDGAEALIAGVTGRYDLALITNGISHVQRPRLAASPLANSFNPVVISDEIGVAKPDPAYFDYAFGQMGWPAREDVLIIGDSLTSDMRGGQNYGVDTCWFNPEGKAAPADLAITYEVRSLGELAGRL